MKKVLLMFALFGTIWSAQGQMTDLIISEYGEGSTANSKYIEIYNGTGADVNLSQYKIWGINNGGTWSESTYTITTATLANGHVLVIANNATDVPGANEYSTGAPMNFSGDDAVGLAKDDGTGTFVLIDCVGTDGSDPGAGWTVAGVTALTKDNVISRKASVCSPNTDWTASSGTDASNSEWEISVSAYTTGAPASMGNHTSSCTAATPELTWVSSTFNESAGNDGTIANTIALSLANETFVTVGALVLNTDYTVANVPSGLTVSITTSDASNAVVSLTGTAASHMNADDVANLTITFLNAAFTGGSAAGVSNSSKSDLIIDYIEVVVTPEITWGNGAFTEPVANDGTLTGSLSIDLVGDFFVVVGTLVENTHYTIGNVPAGLTANLVSSSNSAATLTFTGNASAHENANDVSNMTLTFLNAAYSSGNASGVTNNAKNDISADFIDAYIIPNLVFTEFMYNNPGSDTLEFLEIYNNGSVAVDLTGYTLTGVTYTFGATTINPGEYLVLSVNQTALQNAFGVSSIQWTSANLSNSGELVQLLTNHGQVVDQFTYTTSTPWNSLANSGGHSLVLCDPNADNSVGTNWQPSTNLVLAGLWASPGAADYICAHATPAITWDAATFTEAVANDGSISTVINLTLSDETFVLVGTQTSNEFTAHNVPAGLTASIEVLTTTTATVTLTGNATDHANLNDISNLEIIFKDDAFTGGYAALVQNSTHSNLSVDFNDPSPELTWTAGTFFEAAVNDGTIGNSINITLTGETFLTTGTPMTSGVDFNTSNVPSGLTVNITASDANNATITVGGTAAAHMNADDISNMGITFSNTAFTGNNAASIINFEKTDFVVDYTDAAITPELIWSGTGFTETLANDGTVEGTVTISILGETFSTVGTLIENTDYTVTNIPSGLSASIVSNNSTEVIINLTGSAATHENANDVSNLGITFLNAAFTGGNASAVTNFEKADLSVDFNDAPVIPTLVITEIMYNSPESGTDSLEFFEIYNTESYPVNLTGYYLHGMTHTFGNVDIAPNSYLVVAVNSIAILNTFGVTSVQSSSGSLNNSGEDLTLYYPNGTVADSVEFATASPWPAAWGTGHSLVLCDVNAANVEYHNWTLSTTYVGENAAGSRIWASPGHADLVCSTNPTLAYSGSTFTESTVNEGEIENTLTLTLTDDEFVATGDLISGTDYIIGNVPAGLTVVITVTSTTEATMSLTGSATANNNVDDVSNLTVEFTDAALVSGFAANMTNYFNNSLIVDYTGNVGFENMTQNNVALYPNPNNGQFIVKGDNLVKIEIYDLAGKLIISETKNFNINTSVLKASIYNVKVYTIDSIENIKMTVE